MFLIYFHKTQRAIGRLAKPRTHKKKKNIISTWYNKKKIKKKKKRTNPNLIIYPYKNS